MRSAADRIDRLDWLAPIFLSDHARERIRSYLGWLDGDQDDRVPGEIRSAILSGRIATIVPNWTHGGYVPNRDEQDGQSLYLWNDEVTRCWVICFDSTGIRVRTLLLDHDTEWEIGERRRLRLRPA